MKAAPEYCALSSGLTPVLLKTEFRRAVPTRVHLTSLGSLRSRIPASCTGNNLLERDFLLHGIADDLSVFEI